MWEAKKFGILEEKPIFYTTFTNIPTILSEVAKELPKSIDSEKRFKAVKSTSKTVPFLRY